MSNKRKCILCPSHEYEYCGKCKPKEIIETWRYIFDSENCRDVYKILENFAGNKISATEANKLLLQYNVPDVNEVHPSLRKNLEDIYKQSEVKGVQEINNLADEEIIAEQKPRRRRYKRKYE